MKYFFNDVEVTEAELKRLQKDATDHFELLEQARKRNAEKEAEVKASKPKVKSKAKAKAYVSPDKVIEGVKASTKVRGSKTETAKSIILELGRDNKVACIEKIMDVLAVTKGNASCYYFNVCKKL